MGSFFLETGLIISRHGQLLEYAARTEDEIYFEEPETGKRVALTEPQFWGEFHTRRLTVVEAFSSPKVLHVPPLAPPVQFRNLADLPTKHQEDAKRKIAYIQRMRDAGITRGQTFFIEDMASRIAEELEDPLGPPGASTIQRWWRRLEQNNGEVAVIISGHASRTRTAKLDEESNRFVEEQIDKLYLVPTRPTTVAAYRGYLGALRDENRQRQSLGTKQLTALAERTFYERISKLPKKDVMTARHGREAARRHFKMIRGHLPADHPLDVVEIDHTPLNLYVIDDLAFLPLGRPWLTVITDRCTGVLLGFYVTFQATGLESIFGAIKHSLMSHHLAYDLWPDLRNPWPAFGLGHRYASDRGGDFLSPRYESAIVSLGSFYERCERRTPWLKGSVERFFLTLEQTFFEAMPGRTFASLSVRGDYDPVKDAVVRFSTLIYLLHKWAADFHNVFVNKRKQASPLELWMDGIGLAPPPYPASMDELNIVLGEHESGSLSQEGIRYAWLNYADETLSELMNLVGKGEKVDYVVCREDLGHIYVLHPRTKEYLRVPCTRPEYASGLTLYQHKYLRKEATERLRAASAIDTLIETRTRISARLSEEVEAKKTAAKVALARVAGINSNAVLEGRDKSIVAPFAGQDLASSEAARAPFTNVPQFRWGT